MKTANIISVLGLAIFMMANTITASAKNNEPARKPVRTVAVAPAHNHNAKPAHNVSPAKPAVKPAAPKHTSSFAPGQHKPANATCNHKPAPKHNACHASARTCKAKNCNACIEHHFATCKGGHGHNHRGCL